MYPKFKVFYLPALVLEQELVDGTEKMPNREV